MKTFTTEQMLLLDGRIPAWDRHRMLLKEVPISEAVSPSVDWRNLTESERDFFQ